MNESKRGIIKALKVSSIADRVGVTSSYIYGLLNGTLKAPPYRAVELAVTLNNMCEEYGIEQTDDFNAVDFNDELDPSLHVSPDLIFMVHSVAFAESRQITAAQLTERFSSDSRLGKLLIKLQAKEVPFVSYEGCIIKREGTW